MKITKTCIICGKNVEMNLNEEFVKAVKQPHNCNIQELPGASTVPPEFREMFISGICPSCWDKML